jgi:hypothetical protein
VTCENPNCSRHAHERNKREPDWAFWCVFGIALALCALAYWIPRLVA